MDLQLYARVLWRFRFLMLLGFVLATSLAFLSMVRVSFDDSPLLTFRHQELWVSRSTLLITEPKFPEGRAVFEQSIPPASTDEEQEYAPRFANPERFVALANLYAQLATSDPVRRIMLEDGRLNGVIEASPRDDRERRRLTSAAFDRGDRYDARRGPVHWRHARSLPS